MNLRFPLGFKKFDDAVFVSDGPDELGLCSVYEHYGMREYFNVGPAVTLDEHRFGQAKKIRLTHHSVNLIEPQSAARAAMLISETVSGGRKCYVYGPRSHVALVIAFYSILNDRFPVANVISSLYENVGDVRAVSPAMLEALLENRK